MRENCAIILAAGDGARMKSKHPKALCQVLFKPMILWVADACRQAQLGPLCAVLGSGAPQVQQVLPQDCAVCLQPEGKGTGYGAEAAREFLLQHQNRDVAVLCADAPLLSGEFLRQALEHHQTSGGAMTAITTTLPNPWGHGRILRDVHNPARLLDIVAEEDATPQQREIREVSCGAYLFQGAFLLEALPLLEDSGGGERDLSGLAGIAVRLGHTATAFHCANRWAALGADDRAGLLRLNRMANKIVVDRLLHNGVNFYCTDGIVISPDAQVGRDTTIAPGTILRGRVTIGEDCYIGPNTVIEDSDIGDGTHIDASLIQQSRVGRGVRIGPNSHLRPGTALADGVKIGNFVEVKNSTLGEKTSVAHLTYIGDSDIGRQVNVGGGVITVNYNGFSKFRTTVEDHAFIGCNTNLVAPVTVEEGAYTAAGSTICQTVERESLGIARARQVNKPGWVEKHRQRNQK